MSPIFITQKIAETVVSIGTGAIVGNLVKGTTPPTVNLYQKITIGVASFALASFAGDLAGKHTAQQIEDIAAEVKKTKDEFKRR